jgi:hypothetical protein
VFTVSASGASPNTDPLPDLTPPPEVKIIHPAPQGRLR